MKGMRQKNQKQDIKKIQAKYSEVIYFIFRY